MAEHQLNNRKKGEDIINIALKQNNRCPSQQNNTIAIEIEVVDRDQLYNVSVEHYSHRLYQLLTQGPSSIHRSAQHLIKIGGQLRLIVHRRFVMVIFVNTVGQEVGAYLINRDQPIDQAVFHPFIVRSKESA